jgi:hypothetical protein
MLYSMNPGEFKEIHTMMPLKKSDKKPSGRGGARSNSGPAPSYVRLLVGPNPLQTLREFCDLYAKARGVQLDPIKHLESYLKDYLEGPTMFRNIEQLKAELVIKEAQEQTGDS